MKEKMRNYFENKNKNAMIYSVSGLAAIIILMIFETITSTSLTVGFSNFPTFRELEICFCLDADVCADHIKRNDFINISEEDEYGNTFVIQKRVVGIEGDEIKIENGVLYINGIADTLFPEADYSGQDMNVVVPENGFFVMGDNRDDSLDSRYYGCFDKKDIISKTLFGIY